MNECVYESDYSLKKGVGRRGIEVEWMRVYFTSYHGCVSDVSTGILIAKSFSRERGDGRRAKECFERDNSSHVPMAFCGVSQSQSLPLFC